jgi:small-conductance mechanosensitive channel
VCNMPEISTHLPFLLSPVVGQIKLENVRSNAYQHFRRDQNAQQDRRKLKTPSSRQDQSLLSAFLNGILGVESVVAVLTTQYTKASKCSTPMMITRYMTKSTNVSSATAESLKSPAMLCSAGCAKTIGRAQASKQSPQETTIHTVGRFSLTGTYIGQWKGYNVGLGCIVQSDRGSWMCNKDG